MTIDEQIDRKWKEIMAYESAHDNIYTSTERRKEIELLKKDFRDLIQKKKNNS